MDEFAPDAVGKLEITLAADPASLQSKKSSREVFDAAMTAELAKYDFLIDWQLSITVDWYGSPRRRWETDELPDLDNWLKPLIDSITGPDRLLVDDSQIKSIDVAFLEGRAEASHIHITMDFMPGRSLPKNGFRFVQLTDSPLCFPIAGDDPEVIGRQIGMAERVLETYKELGELGLNDQQRYQFLAIGFVHRSRLGSKFEVVRASTLRASLELPPA